MQFNCNWIDADAERIDQIYQVSLQLTDLAKLIPILGGQFDLGDYNQEYWLFNPLRNNNQIQVCS